MGSVAELKDAVKDALARKGLLPQLQASVRSQIFNVLLAAEDSPRPEPCDETLIINELIREYLVWHGLRDTLSVFIPESGQPATRPFDRAFLEKRLKVDDKPPAQQLPLLYHLVAQQQQQAPASSSSSSRSQEQQQQQQQQQHRQQEPIAAGRLPPPPGAAAQQQHLVLKGGASELSDMQSLSSLSESTHE